MSFPVEVRKNQEYHTGDEKPRYFLEVDLNMVAPGRKASLPIYWRSNSSHPVLKEIYHTEIGGFAIERGNLPSLLDSVKNAMGGMMENGTLPYYSIVLPNGNRLSIFLVKDKLQARIGRTKIEGKDIADVYKQLREALKGIGMITNGSQLKVNIFLWHDLRLYPPAFILRDIRERVWTPIFCSLKEGEAMLNYDEVNRPSEMIEIKNVLNLRDQMAYRIASYGTVRSANQIFMDQTHDAVWKTIREQVDRTDEVLSYEKSDLRFEIPIYTARTGLIAADRPKVFFGKDPSSLASVVAEVLKANGTIASSVSLRLDTKRR
ncbi:MAG: hypothetical protein GKC03_04310 [Methanomassiliicoccales archaeon]|nr:hypothetical protein [Methanomassiliicoccales archaeon]